MSVPAGDRGAEGSQWLRGLLMLAALWTWLFHTLRYRSLRGKRALVTGAGRGLGRDLSLQLAALGCKLVCVDKDPEQVQRTLRALKSQLQGEGEARGYACDWRHPGAALGLSRAVRQDEGCVDILFILPDGGSCNKNADNVDTIAKAISDEFWPVLGFLPGMMVRSRGEVVHVLSGDEAVGQLSDKAGLVADSWVESLLEVGAEVTYTKVRLQRDSTLQHSTLAGSSDSRASSRFRPSRTEDVARSIVSAVRLGSREVQLTY